MNESIIQVLEIRRVIARLLPAGHPTLESVARQLKISPRTLQRHLAKQGLTHSKLVYQVRMTRACQKLSQSDVQISEIASEVGFATPSSSATPFSPGPGLHRGTLEKAPGNYRISDGGRNASTFDFPLLYQELVPENVYDIMSLEPKQEPGLHLYRLEQEISAAVSRIRQQHDTDPMGSFRLPASAVHGIYLGLISLKMFWVFQSLIN